VAEKPTLATRAQPAESVHAATLAPPTMSISIPRAPSVPQSSEWPPPVYVVHSSPSSGWMSTAKQADEPESGGSSSIDSPLPGVKWTNSLERQAGGPQLADSSPALSAAAE
jgi:hypothetical protein